MDPALGVLIVAQGLLMYLEPAEVRELFTRCAERFPGGTLLFDVVPRWFSTMTKAGRADRRGYKVPPMPWGVRSHELLRDARTVPLVPVRLAVPGAGPGPAGPAGPDRRHGRSGAGAAPGLSRGVPNGQARAPSSWV
ncbi:hypothetical protein ACFQ0T_01945 [Kitasatospora gansuensis]